jgi:hypothetical protein
VRSSTAFTRAIISIIALPMLMALGWLLYQQILVWTLPPPRWVIPRPDWTVSRCIDVADLPSYWLAHPAPEDIPADAIPSDEAREIADRAISRHRWAFGEGFYAYSLGPEMVYAAFPDGTQRLVWFRIVVTERGPADATGRASAVYIDAMTGEPLVLITGVTVTDLLFSCRYDEEAIARALHQRVLAFGMVGICLLFALAATGISRTILARREAQEEAQAVSADGEPPT